MEIVTVSSVSKTTIVTMLLYLLHLCMKLGASVPPGDDQEQAGKQTGQQNPSGTYMNAWRNPPIYLSIYLSTTASARS